MIFEALKEHFQGDIYTDELYKRLYSTDASVYQILPQAVTLPKTDQDLKTLIHFAHAHNTSLIPRTAGTSLAGQCVGSGIIVDVSKYFNKIGVYSPKKKTISVQPGVIRDELNMHLEPYGVFFGPNTSTSNRCMIGGMVGNNSSGTTSIVYGTTRDKVKSVKCILSDNKEVHFYDITIEGAIQKSHQNDVEGRLYKFVLSLIQDDYKSRLILESFPKPEIHRRNTGYAIDIIVAQYKRKGSINLSSLICGSEGTLGFITEIELLLDPLPPKFSGLVAAHFYTIKDCMDAVSVGMKHHLYACEMMDDTILNCTKNHLEYSAYRFFLEEDPKAILLFELKSQSEADLSSKLDALQNDLSNRTECYAAPVLKGKHIEKAFTLRKAGLGLLGSIAGDAKAVACIEDTAVALSDLSSYIADFSELMLKYQQDPVYYAHAGAGELHLRPILNLKTQKGIDDFKAITTDVAHLVKTYKGSMSGEHGDGIVRSNFIPLLLGEQNYAYLQRIKTICDPNFIFNPGKIIQALPIDANLRYDTGNETPKLNTFLNFESEINILSASENCNGSGDCRKTEKSGTTMCPSYHATRDEKDTTRARANTLRHYLTHPDTISPDQLMGVFDLCISCKACKRECPSNVDASSFKAEVTHAYYKTHKRPLRDYIFAHNDTLNKNLFPFRHLYNFSVTNTFISSFVKSIHRVHKARSLPQLSQESFMHILKTSRLRPKGTPIKTVYLFVDEFTNRLESHIGKDALELLVGLGYEVKYLPNKQSGRALLSKGFLDKAKKVCTFNVNLYKDVITKQTPLIGIEPSAILCFRDDYTRLYDDTSVLTKLSENVFLIEEFIAQEIMAGHISSHQFSDAKFNLKIHVHCHQKALSNMKFTFDCVNVVKHAKVSIIPSGCCGMAGGFGYEDEHYELSKHISNLHLIPAIKRSAKGATIISNGSSCRHQIKDFTQRTALHPVSFLRQNLI